MRKYKVMKVMLNDSIIVHGACVQFFVIKASVDIIYR